MNKPNSASKIKMNSFNDLFGLNDSMRELKDVRNVMVDELYDFKNHPFKPCNKEKFDELVSSIREHGVLIPGIARIRPEGGYELIAGHNRRNACKAAGISTMPIFIRNMNDDEAVIAMVESNIQREDILPSEKAKAYRMRYEAMKHQGKKGNSLTELGELYGENVKSIQRYIWLSRLINELLEMVDKKKLGIVQGVDISFLKEKEQRWVLAVINETGIKVNTKQSKQLKDLSKERLLSEDKVRELLIMTDRVTARRKIVLSSDMLDKYFPDNYSEDDIKNIIVELLDKWKADVNDDNAG
ncbi:MAG: ParB/RepB/Spo0J family partition protein [Eubacterium sp.]|nr:ParB/RepB/Spo0J family partition protein [Eubacterium sp.]